MHFPAIPLRFSIFEKQRHIPVSHAKCIFDWEMAVVAPSSYQGSCLLHTKGSEVAEFMPGWTPSVSQHGCSHYVVREGSRAYSSLCGAHTEG